MAVVPIKTFSVVYGIAEAELCNRALARIGSELIKDTIEQTKSARACREIYKSTRNEVLRTAVFNFAIESSRIPLDATYPHEMDNYAYAFRCNDYAMLKILNVNMNNETKYVTVGEFTDRYILTDGYTEEDPVLGKLLEVKYVAEAEDPAAFDPLFQDALVLRLASKLAPSMTQTPQVGYGLMNEYAAVLRQAATAASEERVVDGADSWWTEEGRP